MQLKALNQLLISKSILNNLAYGYTFCRKNCFFDDMFETGESFLTHFDKLIYQMLTECGIEQYISGNIGLEWGTQVDCIDEYRRTYYDVVFCRFTLFGHKMIICPSIEEYGGPTNPTNFTIELYVEDQQEPYFKYNQAVELIKSWIITYEQFKANKVKVNSNDLSNEEKLLRDNIVMHEKDIKFQTEKAYKFTFTGECPYKGWMFWWPKSCTEVVKRNGINHYVLLSLKDQQYVTIVRNKKGPKFANQTKRISNTEFKLNVQLNEDLPF